MDGYKSVKTKRTFYTKEKLENLRKNIKNLSWASDVKTGIIKAAEIYLSYGVDKITSMILSQDIARSYDVSQERGCPLCGEECIKHGRYAWTTDFINYPWKVKCPNCGALFPSNDFGSYYESGLDEHGVFRHIRADKTLLVNTTYPDKPSNWCVDDGNGWLYNEADPEKSNFTFIAYYAHFACWHLRTANPGFGSEKKSSVQRIDSILKAAVTNYGVTALQMLSLAYLMTEDIRYGHAGAQILLRIAEIYPEMDVSVYPWEKGFKQSHGGAGLGTITGRISDCFLTREIALSYDALFPAITDEFAGYISGNKLRYMSEPPKKGKEIRNIIESKFLTEIFQNVKDNRVFGNPGMQQNTLLAAGVVSENDELLRQYTDYVFRFVNHERTMQHVYDVDSILINEIDRDGHAGEVSPAYNSIWFSGFCDLAENLAGREGLEEYDLYNNPKFLNMAKMDKNTLMIDRYTLPIADSIMAGEPIIYTAKSAHQKFFKKTGSINSAQLIHAVSDGENYCDDLFSDCAAIDEEIRKIVREHGPLQSESRCLSGYGLYVLEKGEEKSSVYMFNGRNSGHGHRDTLSIGLHGFGVDLTPDHGYPNYADRNYERMRWTSNTISHNTVFVNHEINHDSNPNVRPQYNGPVYHFDSDSLVGVIDCASPTIFENTPLYRRSVVSVALDEESRYIVDFFRVGGDAEHVYSFHAAGFETESRGIQLEKQEKGTYAGDEIPFADEEYSKNSSTGYNYLDEVSRCKSTDAPFSLDWKIHDNWHVWEKPRDVHLRLHMLSNLEECATATGRPPQARPGNAEKFTYLLAKKNGEGCFTSVIEPYENNSFIEDSRIVFDGGTEQCAIVVKHKTGREDIIICSISNKVVSFLYGKNDIDFSGHMTVLSFDTDGSLSYIYVNDGNRLEVNGVSYDCCPSHECSIEGFTKVLSRDNFVDVKTSANPYGLKGKHLYVENDGLRNAFYTITEAESIGKDTLRLNIGDCTLIREYADRLNGDFSYRFDIEEGMKARILTTAEIHLT